VLDAHNIRILVVDSDGGNRQKYLDLLRSDTRHAYEFGEAASVDEGLKSYSLEGHDCLLVAASLQKDRGIEFVRRLVRLHGQMAVPVVFIMPESRQDLGIAAIKAGANDLVIQETVSEAALVRAVTNAVTQMIFDRETERQQRELEVKNHDLNAFSAIVAHDLKSPLFKVQLLAETLKTVYASSLDDKANRYLAKMKDSLTRMQSLIDALLNYAVVTNKKDDFVRVDLRQVIEEALADLEAHIQMRAANILVGETGLVTGDPILLRQLVQNLVGNALKYSREDAAPEVRIWCENGVEQDGKGVCRLHVKDNGIGFDAKDGEMIFQPFQRLHKGDAYGGIGMGLATCRKIAELHGGAITATGRQGEGATFTVRFPG
jgi:signal transduction histidine kinase